MRVAENNVVGAIEEIQSDVKIPDTRIPSESETGTESSSGDITTEWNIDEQDDWLASLFCSEWVDDLVNSTDTKEVKTLELGNKRDVYSMIKKYPQEPVEWKHYTGLQLNQLSVDMSLNSFVKMTWSWLGGNYPIPETTDPVNIMTDVDYGTALTTKSFKTLEGSFKMGDSEDLFNTPIRQASVINLTVNNNKERTDALFETEAIEMSDGDFLVEGSFDIWKADQLAIDMEKNAVEGKKKWFSIIVSRVVGNVKTSYEIKLYAKVKTPAESKDGNKLKTTINYSVHDKNGIKIIKTVETL